MIIYKVYKTVIITIDIHFSATPPPGDRPCLSTHFSTHYLHRNHLNITA